VFKSKKVRWTRVVECVGETLATYNILMGKHEGKRSFEMDVDQIHLA
jgi:hypothetical protein